MIESAAAPAAASASSPATAPGNQSPKEAKSPVAASRSNPSSPKSKSTSPREGSPEAVPVIAEILPAQHWVDTAQVCARAVYGGLVRANPVLYIRKISVTRTATLP